MTPSISCDLSSLTTIRPPDDVTAVALSLLHVPEGRALWLEVAPAGFVRRAEAPRRPVTAPDPVSPEACYEEPERWDGLS